MADDGKNEGRAFTRRGFSRRTFMKSSGAIVALTGLGTLQACDTGDEQGDDELEIIPDQHGMFATNAPPPPENINRQSLQFFTPSEARMVEALTARIFPGDADDPGAREGGVVTFIDIQLSRYEGFWQPTYREPPYAQTYEGDEPPDDEFDVIWVQASEIDRYGYQSVLTPREQYRLGLASLNRFANEEFGANFVGLSEDQQDSLIEQMAGDEDIDAFDTPSASDFFELVRGDTINGLFSDPAYGGNRDMVGWRYLDYPGAQRAYTPIDMMSETNNREPQSLVGLEHFNPSQEEGPNSFSPVASADNIDMYCEADEQAQRRPDDD